MRSGIHISLSHVFSFSNKAIQNVCHFQRERNKRFVISHLGDSKVLNWKVNLKKINVQIKIYKDYIWY